MALRLLGRSLEIYTACAVKTHNLQFTRQLSAEFTNTRTYCGDVQRIVRTPFQNCYHSLSNSHFETSFQRFSTSAHMRSSKFIGQNYDDGRLLYLGSSAASTKGAQGTLYSLGAVMLCVAPSLLQHASDSTFLAFFTGGWMFFIAIGNPMMFYKFAQRYVHELYHNREKDEYTAFVISPFVIGHKKIVFSPHDCKMPATVSTFTSFLVKGKPMFINSDEMEYMDYSRMLRYASDFDYENPDRQTQYKDAVKEAIDRISKKDGKKS